MCRLDADHLAVTHMVRKRGEAMMGSVDPRDRELARILVRHSTRVKPGEMVFVQVTGLETLGLASAVVEETVAAGAAPFLHVIEPRIQRRLLMKASEDVFRRLARFELKQMKDADVYIGIRGAANVFETSDVPRKQLDLYNRLVVEPVHFRERVCNTRWVVLRYPNPSMAQLAQMSTDGFADFFYRVCCVDYARMQRAVAPLQKLMENTDRVRICGPDTDLQFSLRGIPAVPCAGECNIPDGECFTAPVRTSVEGTVQFNTPTVWEGAPYENVRLRFERGRAVEASAATPEQTRRLNRVLDQDAGARYVGEFSIAFHPHILQPMRDILFDEKIAGSFHMALGRCYDQASNGNKSVVHWDLVCIQRPECGGGEIWFDGRLIRKDGRFVVKELAGLNPEKYR
jgi:aminopeptidase